MLIVTTIAAVISYGHAYRLVTRYGESGTTASALPLTVDGLVATCSLVILHYTRKDRRAPWHAWALLITGVCATVGANVSNGLDHGIIGAIVAGWPALVAVGSFELLIRLLRDHRPVRQLATPGQHPGGLRELDNTRAEPAEDGPPPEDAPPSALEPEILVAQRIYADDLRYGRIPSVRRLKREMHIGHPKASRIHAALTRQARPGAAARQATGRIDIQLN